MRRAPLGEEAAKNLLIEAAVDLMGRYGYHGVSIDSIVAKAGVTKGTFYYYLHDKQELLYLIHERFINDLVSETRRATNRIDDPSERLHAMVGIAVRALARHLPAARVFFSELRHLEEPYRSSMREKRDQYELLWRETLKQGIEAGHFRASVDPALCTRAFLGMINWMYQWYRTEGPSTPEQLATQFTTLMLNGIARGAVPTLQAAT